MNKNKSLLTAGLVLLLLSVGAAAFFLLAPKSNAIRVACVGDSLTQSTEYPYDLWMMLGTDGYELRNFGAGATLVSLKSETPYMNLSMFQSALDFQPDIVIIMLGTNDAQPSVKQYNTSFVGDYVTLINAFQGLASKPDIWVVLPPPIFSNQSGKMDPEYFKDTIIPDIRKASNMTDLPVIDVYSALINHPDYFSDGVHPKSEAAKIIADEVYKALTMKTP